MNSLSKKEMEELPSQLTSVLTELIQEDIATVVESLDIEFKLKIVNDWLTKNNTTYIKDNIGQICIKISDVLDKINQKISYHNTKWLSSWRTLDIKDDIIFLEKYCNILNQRLYLINC
jgi:hypothetical protein